MNKLLKVMLFFALLPLATCGFLMAGFCTLGMIDRQGADDSLQRVTDRVDERMREAQRRRAARPATRSQQRMPAPPANTIPPAQRIRDVETIRLPQPPPQSH